MAAGVNYRHAFHAGNAADCLKHAVLVWVLRALMRKDRPLFVLDTHAGIGRYDLDADPAQRTGEAAGGIRRLLAAPAAPLADYLGVVGQLGLYPGSPAIIAGLLRPGDRAAFCELHPEDHALLRRNVGRNPRMGVHLRDGYEAIGAFLPPAERRGLTLIDPPYEQPDEMERLVDAIATAQARFGPGVVLAWYPVKHRAPVRGLHTGLQARGLRDVVAVELLRREPVDAARLNGSGLIVVNPPYGFEAEIPPILAALLAGLGDREAGEGTALVRLCDE